MIKDATKKMKMYTCFIVFLLVLSLEAQNRGLWVIRDQLQTREQIDSVVKFAEQNKYTDLFVQVRGRGRVLYQSSFEDYEFQNLSFDPLKYIVQKCSNSKLRVHAWVNMFLIWSGREAPVEKRHPFNRFRQFILRDFENHSFDEIYTEIIKKQKLEGYYLSPASPEVQEYLLDILKEICMKYQIQGIHLDYFRYPKNDFIFDPMFLNYLSNKYHYNINNLTIDVNNLPNQKKREIAKLLSRPIDEFIKKFHNWLQEYFPAIQLSVAVKADPDQAFMSYYQNWRKWIDDGVADFVCSMLYTNDSDRFRRTIFKLRDLKKNGKIWIGIGAFNKSRTMIHEQIQQARSLGFQNFNFFSYKYMRDNKKF
jgi:uncharacterized lipoprotein YddW (UPF0748 family)